MAGKAMPDGYHSVTPSLVVPEVATLLDFLTQVFEAHELHRLLRPDGTNPRMLAAKTIPDFEKQFRKDDPLILGAQATVELWYADPLTDVCLPGDQKEVCPQAGLDRTMGTVFTRDHFGPLSYGEKNTREDNAELDDGHGFGRRARGSFRGSRRM